MIKQEYMGEKNAEATRPTVNLAAGSGAGYDTARVASEKKTMRILDQKRETGMYARNKMRFETADDMKAVLPDRENAFSETADKSYTGSDSRTDVEKNIYEAERYINLMVTQNHVRDASGSHKETQKPLPSTVEISAFEPKTGVAAEEAETKLFHVGNEDAAIAQIGNDAGSMTGQTKAYPLGSVTEQTKAYPTGDMTGQTKAYPLGGMTGQTKAYPLGSATEQTKAYPIGDMTGQTKAYPIGGMTGQTKAYPIGGMTGQTKAYPLGGMEGQTKAYPVGDMTGQTKAYPIDAATEQTKAYGVLPDSESTRMVDAYSDHMSEFQNTSDFHSPDTKKERSKSSKKKRIRKDPPVRFEYTSTMQNDKIASDMERHYRSSKIRLGVSALLAVLLFLIENIEPVKALFPTRFVFLIVDWVLVLLCVFCISDRLIEAFKSFFRGKPEVDCITVLALFFSLAATTLALVFEQTESALALYNFPFSVCVFLDVLFVYYRSKRDIYSFAVLSSSEDKRAIVLEDSAHEDEEEAEYFSKFGKTKSVGFGAVKRVEFIDGYFAHAAETPNVQAPLKIFIPLCLAVSAVFFACSLLIMKYSIPESLGVAYATFMMCTPFSAFLAYCYPLYLSARRAYSHSSAILCDKTPDTYKDSSTVVFRDTEAIPGGNAKVKGIRLYGDKKIDHVIYYAASLYSVLGGPLEEVFRNAALGHARPDQVKILDICDCAVCAMVGDKNIVIGRPAYMEEQCFGSMPEQGDEEYDGKTNKRIFYLACDQVIIAKFYIQYSVSAEFLSVAKQLFSAGLGVSVQTADPCLDDGIFYENKLDPEECALYVSRGRIWGKDEESVPANRAGVISVGDVKELVKTLLVCKRLENVRRTNLVLHVISSVFAVAVMALVIFTGNAVGMYSVFPALYQLFWILPTYFVSKVYL
ncbi:MAG: hypothetical protein IJD59_04010 [Clostridia bacterium]|nr:hypothetical protein [Clostridia bacterium]